MLARHILGVMRMPTRPMVQAGATKPVAPDLRPGTSDCDVNPLAYAAYGREDDGEANRSMTMLRYAAMIDAALSEQPEQR